MKEVRNIIVGFDFGKEVSQLCYYNRREGQPVSIPMKVGTGQYTFPNCLSKKSNQEEWHFGLEVDYFAEQHEEIRIADLYEICSQHRTFPVDGEERNAGELLGIFILKALRILGVPDPVKTISGLMVTTPVLGKNMVENLRDAFSYMGFSRNRCFIQDYEESFYYHTLCQKPELWSRKVALFQFRQDEVSFSNLIMDKKKKPVQVGVQRGETVVLHKEGAERDFDFYEFIQESMGNDVYSSIFLVGEGFEKEWAKRSTALLCRHQRHVFYGNNLFAKGACFAAKEKTEERNLKGYLYTGNDLVRIHIGMDMMVFGTPAYHSLIQAGVNWYEAMGECELLLDDTKELTFVVSDMENGKKERYSMALHGLPDRPAKATRLRVHLEFQSPKECFIRVEDLGFGDLYPSSGLVWNEIMKSQE